MCFLLHYYTLKDFCSPPHFTSMLGIWLRLCRTQILNQIISRKHTSTIDKSIYCLFLINENKHCSIKNHIILSWQKSCRFFMNTHFWFNLFISRDNLYVKKYQNKLLNNQKFFHFSNNNTNNKNVLGTNWRWEWKQKNDDEPLIS